MTRLTAQRRLVLLAVVTSLVVVAAWSLRWVPFAAVAAGLTVFFTVTTPQRRVRDGLPADHH